MKKIIVAIVVFFTILSFAFLFRKSFLPLAANGADYILRTLIGSANTLKIESFVFSVQDKINLIHPKTVTSADSVFNLTENTAGDTTSFESEMSLIKIPTLTLLPPFAQEGEWKSVPISQYPHDLVIARTLIHVDSNRPYAYVALTKMSGSKFKIGSVAGTKQPGGPIGNPGMGKVPEAIKAHSQLVAAFDGGFQYRDGAYGMIADGKTFVPLRNNLATLLIDDQGKASIIEYIGQSLQKNIVSVRQNGSLLVQDGQITSFTEGDKDTWGRTVTNSIYTWRSGVGITANGDVIYAVGPSLVPRTLALALQSAGAVNAMQLDINPYWVRFVFFKPTANGDYTSKPLLKNMENGGNSYLHGYEKDFFYVYAQY